MGPEGGIEWAHAETLALGSLLTEGVPVRSNRPGYRARHLQPAAPGAARREDRRSPGHPSATCPAALAPMELHNSPLVGAGDAGLRVWLQRRRSRGPGAVGGAVRRLHQRCAGHHRPVHFSRSRQVGPDHPAHPAAAPWLRGSGPRAFQCPAWRGSSISPPRATSGWPTAPLRPSTSTCCAARHSEVRQRPLIIMSPPRACCAIPWPYPAWRISPRARFQPVIDDPSWRRKRGTGHAGRAHVLGKDVLRSPG